MTIPKSVTNIGYSAFWSCESLASVTIPEGVTSIGNSAFYNCTNLASVALPASVTSIGSYAFYNCNSLGSVTLPASVTSIGSLAFYNCNSLKKVAYKGTLAEWCGIDWKDDDANPLYNSKAVLYINDKELTEAIIPDSVTEIKDYAFYNCKSLTDVTIPASVTAIGSSAFNGCESLASVTIPEGVTSIKSEAFRNCNGIEKVTYKGTLAQWCGIEWSNSSANPLYNSKAVLYIGDKELTEADIPDGVTEIKDYAFYNCKSLTDVTLPASVTSVGSNAFYNCNGIEKVTYKGTLAEWCNIDWSDSSANPLNNGKAVLYIGDKELTVADIPDGVTSIGTCAFYVCSNLASITIPVSVKSVSSGGYGTSSFYNCYNLKNITYAGTEEQWKTIKGIDDCGLSNKTVTGKDGET